ncbi:hypothetical protein MRS44_002314 [Fusarium solani]|uniref:uncharacterized protein n=1 Tax=Fusarium solani TaxID=169388 RepID=UPI0032C460E8|nr:hypothetical protein MRS44_002314 [Fusarium solani]
MSLTRDTFIYRGALVIGLLPSLFGLNALLRPEASLKYVEFPVPEDPESRKLVFGLMRIYGIRNVVVSFALALIWLTGNKRLVGLGLVGGLSMAIADGLQQYSPVPRGQPPSNNRMGQYPEDVPIPFIYSLSIELIDDKVKFKQALAEIYGDIRFTAEENNGSYAVKSAHPGPLDLMSQLREIGVTRKE